MYMYICMYVYMYIYVCVCVCVCVCVVKGKGLGLGLGLGSDHNPVFLLGADNRPDAAHRPQAGDPARRSLLRPHVVRSGRYRGVGYLAARRRLALRRKG